MEKKRIIIDVVGYLEEHEALFYLAEVLKSGKKRGDVEQNILLRDGISISLLPEKTIKPSYVVYKSGNSKK